MHSSSVFLLAFLTAIATATGTVYFIERYNVFQRQAGAEAVVPDLRGATESDARANATAAHVALFVASREPTADNKGGTVIRQSMGPGQRVPMDSPISVVIAEELPKVPGVVGISLGEATQRV